MLALVQNKAASLELLLRRSKFDSGHHPVLAPQTPKGGGEGVLMLFYTFGCSWNMALPEETPQDICSYIASDGSFAFPWAE